MTKVSDPMLLTGADLRTHRIAAGLTQAQLARRAGVGRHAVQYWEAKGDIVKPQYAPKLFCEVLGMPYYWRSNARAGGWGLTWLDRMQARLDAEAEARLIHLRTREAERHACRRVICGAKTRKGLSCRNKSEAGKARCKFHGGKSTGPKTAEGKARIAEAQRKRWAAWRC
jgi:transcriptional regulator with XRE-family HTH domain